MKLAHAFGRVRYRKSCQERGALTWIEFVQSKQSQENSSCKLKSPSVACKQRVFFHLVIICGQLVKRAVKDIAALR